ncbi:hypothetical protein D9M69_679290 [compost metagenome]
MAVVHLPGPFFAVEGLAPDRADAQTAEGVGELGGTCHADEAVVVLRVGLEELVQRFLAALAYAVVASERITSNSWVSVDSTAVMTAAAAKVEVSRDLARLIAEHAARTESRPCDFRDRLRVGLPGSV